MLKKHGLFFVQGLFVFDLILLAACWVAAYFIRFYMPALKKLPFVGKLFAYEHLPSLRRYLYLLAGIVLIWAVVLRFFKIYKPRRTQRLLVEGGEIFRAFSFGFMVLVAANYFLMRDVFSRGCLVLFYGLGLAAVTGNHLAVRLALRRLRSKGYNLRRVLIAGAGRSALGVARLLEGHREMGYRVVGLLGAEKEAVGTRLEGYPVIGTYQEVADVVRERAPDEVVIALPAEHQSRFYELLGDLSDGMTNIHVVPDFMHVSALRVSVDVLEGVPFISMRTTPAVGWGGVGKRAFDAVVALLGLLLLGPLIALIALLIKLTSKGPVFYAQERMGLDGRTFRMLKFRSMREDAEAEGLPGWTTRDDPRRTRIGRFLRRTSLDELPQLFNVLKGQMSLVGPRPERPVFVEEFRKTVPKYMLRHKIKAGMTGWAQVNGWRGDTSIEERIKHDIYYIEHWSLGFDLRILWLTLWRGFINRQA